jgi:hypothetical protein
MISLMPERLQQFRRWISNPYSGGELGSKLSNQIMPRIYPYCQKAIQSISQPFNSLHRDSKVLRGIFVTVLISTVIIWVKKEPNARLPEVFIDNLETIAIASAGVIFILEIPDRLKRDQYEAWQVINSALEQTGSGGRIQALEDLNKGGVSLEGLSASGAYLHSNMHI